MELHRFKIDENKRGQSNNFYHVRRFFHLYTNDDKEIFDAYLEIALKKPKLEFAWKLDIGNAGSETPFDGHVEVLGSSIFWGVSAGRKLAQKITESKEERYGDRSIGFYIGDGHLRISGWVPKHGYRKGRFAKWRTLHVDLNPMTYILGPKQYTYKDVFSEETTVSLPDGDYPVIFKLQEVHYGRVKGKTRFLELTVDVDAIKGIPIYVGQDWKGNEVYGFGVKAPFKVIPEDWVEPVKMSVMAWIYRERGINNWHFESQE